MAEFTKLVQLRCVAIAKQIAPFRTGNLRASIRSGHFSPKEFVITYRVSDANYAIFLEEGTKHFNKHKGFISVRTAGAIGQYIESWLQNNKSKVPYNYQRLARESRTNPARQERFLRSQRAVSRSD